MSGPAATVRAMTGDANPWRRLRELTGWTLRWHDPASDGRMGFTTHTARAISLRADLTYEQRRCTVLHECLHAEHGPVLRVFRERHENDVRRRTAQILLPDVERVADTLAWTLSYTEAAQELQVDTGVLRDRLRWLGAAECRALAARVGCGGLGAA